MAVKSTGQFSFVEALAPQLASGGGRLDRLHGLVKWYRFEKVLATLRMTVRVALPIRPC